MLQLHVTVHRVRGHASERQPDADALMVPCLELLGLLERLEDARRRVGVDAGTLIDHADGKSIRGGDAELRSAAPPDETFMGADPDCVGGERNRRDVRVRQTEAVV